MPQDLSHSQKTQEMSSPRLWDELWEPGDAMTRPRLVRVRGGCNVRVGGVFEAGKAVGSGKGSALDSPGVFRAGDRIGGE